MTLPTATTPRHSRTLKNVLLAVVVVMSVAQVKAQNDKPTRRYNPNVAVVIDSIAFDSLFLDLDSPIELSTADSLRAAAIADSLAHIDPWAEKYNERSFSPNPTRAVWMSALFPGLGQIYNRRFWKVPIVIGGFMGLSYAATWNSGMLTDYSKAYHDLTDNDPNSKSYMDFFPKGTDESSLDHTWLVNTFKSKKDYFRRNRDLCIIAMVGVYLLSMIDAYVDASLTHFDISPDLSMQVVPTLIHDCRNNRPSVGMTWAINF